MNKAIKNGEDQIVIRALQDAWRQSMAIIYDDYGKQGLDADRRIEVEREKARNAILRAKTSDALAGWYLRFVADATKGNSIKSLRENSESVREFIFNSRNFERFQNLCLFALLSYETRASEEEK